MNPFFWSFYIIASLLIALILANAFKNRKKEVFLIISVILLTPSKISFESQGLAPSLFVFSFDLLLERNFSTISLRPLALSLPSMGVLIYIYHRIKKRF